MEFGRRTKHFRASSAAAVDDTLVPGKRRLTELLPVQRREAFDSPTPGFAATEISASAPSVVRPCYLPLHMLFGVQRIPTEGSAQVQRGEVHAAATCGTATSATKPVQLKRNVKPHKGFKNSQSPAERGEHLAEASNEEIS